MSALSHFQTPPVGQVDESSVMFPPVMVTPLDALYVVLLSGSHAHAVPLHFQTSPAVQPMLLRLTLLPLIATPLIPLY